MCYNCYRVLSEESVYLVEPNPTFGPTNQQSDQGAREKINQVSEKRSSEPIDIILQDKKTRTKTTYSFTFIEEEKVPSGKAYYFQVIEQEAGQAEVKLHKRELSREEFFAIKSKLSKPNRRHLRRNARFYASFIAGLPTSN